MKWTFTAGLSEHIGLCLSVEPVALLDINNTVPADLHEKYIQKYQLRETFMGFHCGSASACWRSRCSKKHVILKRSLEPDDEPDITRETIEGDLKEGAVTVFRLQVTAAGELKAYVARGEILPVPSHSFGSIGVFGIPEMERFYRHVLLEKRFPHHAAVAWGDLGGVMFDVFRCLHIENISYNQPKSERYPTENPLR